MNDKIIKNPNKLLIINAIINVMVCISIVIIYGFNVWALCIGYILTDIILSLLNKIYASILAKKLIKGNSQLSNLKNFLEDAYMNAMQYNKDEAYIYQNLHKKLTDKMEEQLKEEKQIQEELERENYKLNRKEDLELTAVNNTINDFVEFYNVLNYETKTDLKEINSLFIDIQKNLSKQPKSISLVGNIFNIYTKELINLYKNLSSISDEKREEYNSDINSLINEFKIYLTKLLDNIINYSPECIDVNINTLLKELQRQNKDNPEQ